MDDSGGAMAAARRDGKRLLRMARIGALATLDGGGPLTTLVGVASDWDGAPLFLMTPVSDTFCGAFDTPKGAWASPPLNGIGGWLGWGALLAAAIASPLLCANAVMSGRALPTFLELLGPRDLRSGGLLTMLLGAALLVTTVISAETALGFVFDPRYKDFPFAALTMAVLPFATLMLLNRPQDGVRPIAESVFAGVLAGSALYTGFNEGADNWQSLWTCAVYFLLAVTLWRARVVQIPK